MSYQYKTISSLKQVKKEEWNALVGENNPFVEYDFLSLLEDSRSVGEGTGWMPAYVLAYHKELLVGATPSYIKMDSYGEYIFDWMWADVYHRLGMEYYPKITTAIPFTSATGPRLLLRENQNKEEVWKTLLEGIEALRGRTGAATSHFLYTLDQEAGFLETQGYFRRATYQFHWRNDDYPDFDRFLAQLKASNRKQIRKERKRIQSQDLEIVIKKGSDITDQDWIEMYHLYRSTSSRKWGSPYLTRDFFAMANDYVSDLSLLCFALHQGKVVAGTLSFLKGKHLYGRYWGSHVPLDCLHFELCYYRLIDYAIQEKLALVEAGAQGEHKIKRGYLPVMTHSAHKLLPNSLHQSIEGYIQQEANEISQWTTEGSDCGPFKQGCQPTWPRKAGIPFEK